MEKTEMTPVEKRLETMKKNKIKRKTKKIIFAIGLTSVVFIVATYAWFMGVTTVNVNQFEVDIAVSEGLSISLDGVKFDTQITLTKDAITTALDTENSVGGCDVDGCYDRDEGRINHWVSSEGLFPISTTTILNTSTSRLDLYSKKSMTSSVGGYRLRANKIEPDDTDAEEGEDRGYIAFDIFLKNATGGVYDPAYNHAEEEGLFLTRDSEVTYEAVGETGGEGIENSLRIAFYQLARTNYKGVAVNTIQSMNCADGGSSYTQLCTQSGGDAYDHGLTWNVWEPNDTAHTDASVARFNRICVKRTSATEYAAGDDRKCDPIADGTYTKTYGVKTEIPTAADPIVNIYDGLNTFDNSDYLQEVEYFTDTQKNENDDTKSEFMYIAQNSITKVRVYIWLEGQDVDNYDISNEYSKMKIAFGLTKDRYEAIADVGEPEEEPEEPVPGA